MHQVAALLLRWYRGNAISYPWRRTQDPYAIWLSEILLQQTRIPIVLQYYEKILSHYPSLKHLAEAAPQEFLALWSGIGYYRRAENMLRCAREIRDHHNGSFPEDPSLLQKLPGIGRYTAGALASVCFRKLTPAIDGNTGRVLARLAFIEDRTDSQEFRRKIEMAFLQYGSGAPPDEYFQALMELGERICLPQPHCGKCPVRSRCIALKTDRVNEIPRKVAKKRAESFHWYMLVLMKRNRTLYTQNPDRDFLKNAWLFPDILSGIPLSTAQLRREFQRQWNIRVEDPRLFPAAVKHTVTFRSLRVQPILAAEFKAAPAQQGRWLKRQDLKQIPTSSLTKKIWAMLDDSLSQHF